MPSKLSLAVACVVDPARAHGISRDKDKKICRERGSVCLFCVLRATTFPHGNVNQLSQSNERISHLHHSEVTYPTIHM